MKHVNKGVLIVSGVNQASRDMDGISVPLAGEIRVGGISRHAIISVQIPNELIGPVVQAINKPAEQIPLHYPALLRLSIKRV